MSDLLRSKAKGDSQEGGHERPFTVVPDESLEFLARDVDATFYSVPAWAVEQLFKRVQTELERPDLAAYDVSVIISFSNIGEYEYERLVHLRDVLNLEIDFKVKAARLYPPRQYSKDADEAR